MCKPGHSAVRIKKLRDYAHAQRYLEIGVRDGATFFHVDMPLKVGVDPAFLFDTNAHAQSGTYFFKEASDKFFASLSQSNHPLSADFAQNDAIRFDIIFLDGLHTFEQTFRDFENSLFCAHEKTIWIIDDTVPSDTYSCLPDYEKSLRVRKEAGLAGKQWHGDVFKTVFAIHDRHPEYSYCTLMGENPQTIVWKSGDRRRKPAFASNEEITRLTYFDMLEYAALLMPVQDGELAELLGKAIEPGMDASKDSRSRLLYNPLVSLKEEKLSKWIRKSKLVRFLAAFQRFEI